VSTFVCERERVRLAAAVELARLPVRPELVAVVLLPLWGVAVTWMTVPRGMLLAVRMTSTGFVVPVGSRTSGAARKLPPGLAGAAMPPTLAIVRLGCPAAGNTGCGKAWEAIGVASPV
jgi:hypothetical protein